MPPLFPGVRHPRAGQPRGDGRDLKGRGLVILPADLPVLRHALRTAASELDPVSAAAAAAPRQNRRPRRQGAQRQAHERDRGGC